MKTFPIMKLPTEVRLHILSFTSRERTSYQRPGVPASFQNIMPFGDVRKPLQMPILLASKQLREEAIVEHLRRTTIIAADPKDLIWLQAELHKQFSPSIDLALNVRTIEFSFTPGVTALQFSRFIRECTNAQDIVLAVNDQARFVHPYHMLFFPNINGWAAPLRRAIESLTTLKAFDMYYLIDCDNLEMCQLRDTIRANVLH